MSVFDFQASEMRGLYWLMKALSGVRFRSKVVRLRPYRIADTYSSSDRPKSSRSSSADMGHGTSCNLMSSRVCFILLRLEANVFFSALETSRRGSSIIVCGRGGYGTLHRQLSSCRSTYFRDFGLF